MGLLVNLVGTTAVLFISSSACKIARQDAWMASIGSTQTAEASSNS